VSRRLLAGLVLLIACDDAPKPTADVIAACEHACVCFGDPGSSPGIDAGPDCVGSCTTAAATQPTSCTACVVAASCESINDGSACRAECP
jgi:hypothetical protein